MSRLQRCGGAGLIGMLWLVLLVTALPALAASRAQASLDRTVIAPGEVATLTITIANEDAEPILPQVPGLHIMLVGQRVSSQYYGGGNGVTSFSRTYEVSADQAGDFTIAPITVDGVRLQPLHLKVSASAAAAAQGQPGGTGGGAADVKRSLPFMRVVLPRTRLYVGEQVPIQIKAYFREGTEAHMEGALAVTGDAFTASGLDSNPVRSEETINGEPWVVLTWSSTLGAIKSGDYPLKIELPLLVRLRVGGNAGMQQRLQQLFGMAHINGFIGDDLDQIFGQQVERHLVLKPPATQVQVLQLPEAGQPANFSGAVGHFDVSAALTPTAGAVGEPLTLKITVTGKGNLARIDTPGLADSPQWRTYHPEEHLTPASESGVAGSKTFTQPIVPRAAGHLTVPGIGISWFDPDMERYETRETPAFTVLVTPAPGVDTPGVAAAPLAAPQAAAVPAVAMLRPAAGRHARSLRPLIRKPGFICLLAAPVAGLLLVLLWQGVTGRIGQVRSRLRSATAKPALYWLAQMDAAITRGDAMEFFDVARRALRERLPEIPAAAQMVFDAADQVAYGGGSMSDAQLREWRERVAVLLAGAGT